MRAVSVSEFRTKISYYLRLVKQGEEFILTRRGKPIVLVAPVSEAVRQEWARSR